MGRKKTKQEEPKFTETEEFKKYKELTDEMFDAKNKVSSSVVSSTIDGLTKDSVIVAVNQSLREPTIIVDGELLNIPTALEEGIKSIPYPINPKGIRKIRNAAQSGRNQWSTVCLGKLQPGVGDNLTTANKIGLAFRVGGYLVTRSSLPYGLFRFKRYEQLFEKAIETYIEKYPIFYEKELNKIEDLYLAKLLESWFIRGDSEENTIYKGLLKRQGFNTKEEVDGFVEELSDKCIEYNEIKEDQVKDFFAYAIADKSVTEDKTRSELFVVYYIDFTEHPDSVQNLVEIKEINRKIFMEKIRAQVPSPENAEAIRDRFSLRCTFDRVPTAEEIDKAREKIIEQEWSAGVKKFAAEAGIKSKVETLYEIQEELRGQISSNWEQLILDNLKDALQDALEKVRNGNIDEAVKYTSVQNLLGKEGANPKAGLLDQLLDIASDLSFGQGKLKGLLEELKDTARKNDAKIISKELELAIKDISEEINKSFGEDISDESINLFDFDPSDITEEEPEDVSQDEDEAIDL